VSERRKIMNGAEIPLSEYANLVHCAVQEIQNAGAESPMCSFERIYELLETIREELIERESK
tara:strand:- start:631 stop:816 length:186 start_codon:yes stop_codon:yes gene_type:complete